ncbi:hypothetical protein [Nocardia sp. NPDC050175]|uniref:hypothetical protein n=1 Tax=Nocardia sp. NPDC050175 TaxID=3364317 RepID=UPI00378F8626
MTGSIKSALDDAQQIRRDYVGRDGYGLVYGSHADGSGTSRSDLDLVLVGSDPLSLDTMTLLVAAVCSLHHRHGLALDTEVDYETKLFATFAEVTEATTLMCFDTTPTGLDVVPVVVEPWFLNSHRFKLRLLLNALTSPHIFLGGDIDRYRIHRDQAERALALLALSMCTHTVMTVADLTEVVIHGPGVAGKDFLGYRDGPQLRSTLIRGLAILARARIVVELDGARFRKRPKPVLAAINRSRPHGRTRLGY